MTPRAPKNKLPYIEKIAQCYEALDLPYGANMEQVDKRWKEYLEKCQPDRHAHNPNLLSDAYKLTGILTYAHGEIIEAWQRFGINTPDLPLLRGNCPLLRSLRPAVRSVHGTGKPAMERIPFEVSPRSTCSKP